MTNRTRTDALLLAGFCAFLFFYGLNQFGLIGADEPRYAQVAHEMLERGDWITPTLGGQPWLEKPPLYYWQAMISYRIFGVSDWAARLPSAFDATLLVLAAYFFLRRFRPGIELDGALILASCAGIIGYARAASTDMPLAATFGIGMLSWWAWSQSKKRNYLLLFYAFVALAALAKGPVALILAVAVVVLCSTAAPESRLIAKSLSLPGLLLFCVIAFPWYVAVQMRNPGFLDEFILRQNLERFSQNLYHHVEPWWFYLPVIVLAVVPWTILAFAGSVQAVRHWRLIRDASRNDDNIPRNRLMMVAACWLITPVLFFSVSRSKLPGYVLLAVPGAALLVTEHLRLKLESGNSRPTTWLAALHALCAAAPVVPGLLIAYLVRQHRLPGGRPMFLALASAFVLCAGIALTLVRENGLRMLRFITLVPVILTVGAVLKLGSTAIDETLSARPLANEIAAIEMRPLPLAVYHVPRELEYGLTFYRNQLTFNYDWGRVPAEEHLLVAPENSQVEIAKLVAGRRVSYLGHYAPQHVDYFWIAAQANSSH
jgi:4-amino-4-deoxy-L-arabinose transferase-like glycosyltransferase